MAKLWFEVFIRVVSVAGLTVIALSFINSAEPMYVRGAGEAILFAAGLNIGTGLMYYVREFRDERYRNERDKNDNR